MKVRTISQCQPGQRQRWKDVYWNREKEKKKTRKTHSKMLSVILSKKQDYSSLNFLHLFLGFSKIRLHDF